MSFINPDYKYEAVNDAYTHAYRKKREEIVGETVERLIGREDFLNKAKPHLDRCFRGEQVRYEDWFTHADGISVYKEVTYLPHLDENGVVEGAVVHSFDLTGKKELEGRLRQAHKMEAIGNLAGGIAHEFNNVLGIIIGNAELAIHCLQENHPAAEFVEEIKGAGFRAKDVVRQLLNFSHKMDVKAFPVDLRRSIKDVLKLLRASIPSSIRIREILPQEIDLVMADSNRIHQLLINLCTNAAQAMREEGGVLTIDLKNADPGREKVGEAPDAKPGRHVRLSVVDTGRGIPPNLHEKIFEPYFTTKAKGQGMGLAVVHGIVKAHEGLVKVESVEGRGTAFHVYFPSWTGAGDSRTVSEKNIPTGNERILFIDDEEAMVKLYRALLESLGYRVVTETDPLKALERFRAAPESFDLVVSDITMPYLTGDRLSKELIKIRPDIPIIVCTGYSDKISKKIAEEIGVRDFLLKPVDKKQIAVTVRGVLDEAGRLAKS